MDLRLEPVDSPVEATTLTFEHLSPGVAYRVVGSDQRLAFLADANGRATVRIDVREPLVLRIAPESPGEVAL